MSDRPPYADSRQEAGGDIGTPRWAKASGLIAVAVVLLVVLMMFLGGGEHGPGRHTSSGDAGADTSSSVTDIGHQRSADGHG